MSTTRVSSIDELRYRLHGGVYQPGDPAYEDACTLFNTMIVRRPRLVAECVADDDRCRAIARGFPADMAPWSIGAVYPSFSATKVPRGCDPRSVRARSAWPPVKAVWDRQDVFLAHQSIHPAAPTAV